MPLDWNENEKRYNWDLVYCELYAGGKYNNNQKTYTLGTNGLGACATQCTSEYMEVVSCRDDIKYSISFKKGAVSGKLRKEPLNKRHSGTIVKWKPDIEVFTDIDIPLEYFTDVLKRQAFINRGITIELIYEHQSNQGSYLKPAESGERVFKESYYYKNGIIDYIKEITGDAVPGTEDQNTDDYSEQDTDDDTDTESGKKPSKTSKATGGRTLTLPVYATTERVGRDREDQEEYSVMIEAVFCFSSAVSRIEYYHNSSFLEHGGSPEKAVRSSFTKAVDNYLKQNNKYSKSDQKISFSDIEESLVLIISSFSNKTSYENQTKKAINNAFIEKAMTEFFLRRLEVYFAENPADAERIATQVMINKRSRENAEVMRINLKKKLSSTLDISNRVEKFANCRSRDASIRELFIVEGDSALGSCKLARNAEFQAIMPVRGKTLNCLKSSYDKIFKNDIIVDLLKVIGCGVEIRSKSHKELEQFDIKTLKWNKIIICTDADEDGYQIRTLILTMLYRLLPTLIREGKTFIAESPLYEIAVKDKIMFAYDEKEKTKIITQLGNVKYTVQRSKGLGENEPQMMWQTTMNPESRRLIKIMPEDEDKTFKMFNVLLGDDIQGRKRFIAENGYRYVSMADI
ncbi:DNA gyrase subunit B [bioreactor metagenome]|uniref:DNA topoisomerase (ATP-hydrolyzing) n=1 Tax=bioreactor metagenome TaxID=1076179 RepID=A0A645AQZ3_9ZZZZ